MSNKDQSLCTCGCGGVGKHIEPVKNLPGLSSLRYRSGTHGSFKKAMLTALSSLPEKDPLSKLTSRYDDDAAIATIDAWATVLDVLSFYQERIVNEGYLRTATERFSIVELAKHISYKLRPGVAAGTFLAFSMNESVGAPLKATISVGTKVQSVPEQDQLPQIFETIEQLDARVEWNALKLQTKVKKIPVYGDHEIYLKGIATGLQPGDGLLMIGDERAKDSKNENWDFRKIKEVIPDRDADHTKITWSEGLGSNRHGVKINPAKDGFKAYALRQRAFLFGYNAPDYRTLSGTVKKEFVSSGLKAEYFNNVNLKSKRLDRIESNIEHNWGTNPPVAGINADNFSIRWSGMILPPLTGEFTFYTISDDGIRLWIDNDLVIDKWIDRGANTSNPDTATKWLQAGQFYKIRVEYYERGGASVVSLSWSAAGLTREVIPAEYFFHSGNLQEWPDFTISAISGAPNTIHLEGIQPRVIKGGWIVMLTKEYDEVYRVQEAVESSRKKFTLTSKTTLLEVTGENLVEKFDTRIRDAVIYIQNEELEIADTPVTDEVKGKVITLEKILPDLPNEKTIIIGGKRMRLQVITAADKLKFKSINGSETKDLHSGDSLIIIGVPDVHEQGDTQWTLQDSTGFIGIITLSRGQWELMPSLKDDETVSEIHEIIDVEANNYATVVTLAKPLANYFDRSTVIVYGNTAEATHGESKQETLGSGNGSKVFQKFELKQKPLTYISAATPSGTETTLQMRVNDILWKEVPTFYGVAPREKVYITSINDDGNVTVQFGDGLTGSRLPTGTENVKATYRIGIGSGGSLHGGQLSMLLSPQLGVNKVINPLPTSGAEDPETIDRARQNAPFTVLTLDRIVSAKDFEDFTRAFAGIGKARADILWNGEQQIVHITIAADDKGQVDKESSLYENLVEAIRTSGHSKKMVYVNNYLPISFTVNARIQVNSDYIFEKVKDKVVQSLKETFSFEARSFGQDVTPSEVIAAIQGVEGVIYVDLEKLNGRVPFAQEHFRLVANIAAWRGSNIDPAQLLVIDEDEIVITQILQ